MRVGSTMLIMGILSVMVGFLYRTSRFKGLSRWMRRMRLNAWLIGKCPAFRVFRG